MSSHTTSGPLAAAAGSITIGDDLTVNRMGFGAMRLTGRGIWGPPTDRPEAIRVLRRAIELGVDFIDTADSYGPEVSEEIIAEALHPYPEGLVIATKGGLERPGPDKWVTKRAYEHMYGMRLVGNPVTHTYCSGCHTDFMQRVRPTRQTLAP